VQLRGDGSSDDAAGIGVSLPVHAAGHAALAGGLGALRELVGALGGDLDRPDPSPS
jgi:hypothetical protein